jgi:uncharacterized Zn finger protein
METFPVEKKAHQMPQVGIMMKCKNMGNFHVAKIKYQKQDRVLVFVQESLLWVLRMKM